MSLLRIRVGTTCDGLLGSRLIPFSVIEGLSSHYCAGNGRSRVTNMDKEGCVDAPNVTGILMS